MVGRPAKLAEKVAKTEQQLHDIQAGGFANTGATFHLSIQLPDITKEFFWTLPKQFHLNSCNVYDMCCHQPENDRMTDFCHG